MLLDYFTRVLAALSQLLNTLGGGNQNESISSRAHRRKWTQVEKVIDSVLFWEKGHCKKAFENDLEYCHKFLLSHKK